MKKLIITSIAFFSFLFMSQAQNAIIFGTIETSNDDAIGTVIVNLYDSNDQLLQQITTNGSYSFSNLTEGANYKVTFEKNNNPLNGVSTFDMVLIAKHILQQQSLSDPYKLYAADINNSGSVTTLDILYVRRMVLAIDQNFPAGSWKFLPKGLTSFTHSGTMNELEFSSIGASTEANVIGVKVGDVNDSAILN